MSSISWLNLFVMLPTSLLWKKADGALEEVNKISKVIPCLIDAGVLNMPKSSLQEIRVELDSCIADDVDEEEPYCH